MFKRDIRTPEDALTYMTDCTLATVTSMAMKKRRPKGEFERQISIAQTGVTLMQEFGIDLESTRAADAVRAGGVSEWAKQYLLEG